MDIPGSKPLPVVSDLPPSLLREIGRICVTYSRIEWTLNRIIYDLLNVSTAEGRLAVRDPAPDQRLDLIQELALLKRISLPNNLSDITIALKESKSKRDSVAHGIWLREPDDGKLFLRLINGTWQPPGGNKKIKRRMHLEGIEFDTNEAKSYALFMEVTLAAVRVLYERVVEEMNRMVDAGTLPDKQPERFLDRDRSLARKSDKPQPTPEASHK